MSDGIDWNSVGSHGAKGKKQSPFRDNILRGRVALVTGGGSGIGLTIAEQLGLHGCNIAIMGRKKAKLDKAAEFLAGVGVKAFVCSGDVRDPLQCQAVVEKVVQHYGSLSMLVNCAAGNFLCLAEDLSPNAFKTVVDIDLLGTFNMSKAAFGPLKATKGDIINITATLHYGATPFVIHAAAAKAGVDALTRGLGIEWGEYGIRVNGIAPGAIRDTEGFDRLVPEKLRADKEKQRQFPVGDKEDVAYACLYLCSDAGHHVNGETLVVDAGSWMAKPPMIPKEFYQKFIRKSKL